MIHHVYACRSNVGDWLAARAIQWLLRDLPIEEHLCDEPFVPKTASRLKTLTRRDLVVIGGGGLFMDYFAPFWDAFEPISRTVPFCIWGAGLCDLKSAASRGNRELLQTIVGRSRLCSVRDRLTRDWLDVATVGEPVECPSMNLVSETAEGGLAVLHAVHYNTLGPEVYEDLCGVLKGFAADTGRVYRETNNVIRTGDEKAFAAGLDAYRDADVVVSSRLHGCIIAVALGRRVLAVSGDRKIEAFMDAMGLADWVCAPERVGDMVVRLAEQPSASARVERAREGNRRIAGEITRIAESLDVAAAIAF